MKYIRSIVIILLIFIIISPLCAATSYEGKVPPGEKDKYEVNFDVDLSKLNLSVVGFSSSPVLSILGDAKETSFISINQPIKSGNGTFESEPVYVYWKFLGSSSTFPELWLKQESALNNANFSKASVDWAVDIKSNEEGAQFVEALNSSNLKVEGVKIYPVIELTATGDENRLAQDANSYTVKLRTTEPYWKNPNVVYTSELWLMVKPK